MSNWWTLKIQLDEQILFKCWIENGLECSLIRSDIEFLFWIDSFGKWNQKLHLFLFSLTDSLQNRLPHPDRPKCNSILHLIGSWLFEAAFIGSEYSKHPSSDQVAPIVNDGHKISVPSLSPKPVTFLLWINWRKQTEMVEVLGLNLALFKVQHPSSIDDRKLIFFLFWDFIIDLKYMATHSQNFLSTTFS